MSEGQSPPTSRFRPLLLGVTLLGIIVQGIALYPTPLEQASPLSPESEDAFEPDLTGNLAPGLPSGLPDYSIDQFHHAAAHGIVREWRMEAVRADFYSKAELVHGRGVKVFLYGEKPDEVTTATGLESKFKTASRDFELFGDVVVTTPDGYRIESDYLLYDPNARKISMPVPHAVRGNSGVVPLRDENIRFTSVGLSYLLTTQKAVLHQAAHVTLVRRETKGGQPGGVPESTEIDSDYCTLDRKKRTGEFRMNSDRRLTERFVRIKQPRLFARSRKADLFYGDLSKRIDYLIAQEDVWIQEAPFLSDAPPEKYATAGRAEFDTRSDAIRLTEFPQAYQTTEGNRDTITGEVIIVHRESDVVEVQQSNAYSNGESSASENRTNGIGTNGNASQ